MALLTYTIFICLINFTLGEDCVLHNVPEYMTWKKELIKDIKQCGYSKEDTPSANLIVNLKFVMKSFVFDSNQGIFSVQNWMFITWADKRLKWDRAKHHDISETEISPYTIWTPNFRLSNSADSYDYQRLVGSRCSLNMTGDVHCVIWMTHSSWCHVKFTNWPYDVQECSLKFEVLNSAQTENYTMVPQSISIDDAEYSSEWHITDYKSGLEDAGTLLKITFTLQRLSVGWTAIIVHPSLILSTLSITVLFLDFRSYIRLGIACYSLCGHYYFLLQLAEDMPMKNEYTPTILLYYRGSVVLTVLIILQTFLLSAMCRWNMTPHRYVRSCNDFVYKSHGVHFVFSLWNLDESKLCGDDWATFADIVNSALIYIVVLAYIIMYGALMPQ